MHTPSFRRILSSAAAAGGAAALLLAVAGGASAHVGVKPDTTDSGEYALLTFSIPHGCEESGTTRMTITLPQELNDAQPTVNPNWTVEKVTEKLAEPRRLADGSAITERTSQIVYTARAPLPHELRDALVLSVKLPEDAGTTLYFPTLQSCETGSTDWSQVPKDGQDPHSLEAPAPAFTLTASKSPDAHSSDGHGGAPEEQRTTAADSGASARSWAGLAAGMGGLALGGAALLRGRKAATEK